MKYNGINWMGWLINIVCFVGLFCMFVLLFGYGGIFWFIGVTIVGISIENQKKYEQTIMMIILQMKILSIARWVNG